jgi:hypothetical protein
MYVGAEYKHSVVSVLVLSTSVVRMVGVLVRGKRRVRIADVSAKYKHSAISLPCMLVLSTNIVFLVC